MRDNKSNMRSDRVTISYIYIMYRYVISLRLDRKNDNRYKTRIPKRFYILLRQLHNDGSIIIDEYAEEKV